MIWNWEFAASILPEILRGLAVTLLAVALGMAIALVLGLVWTIARRSQSRIIAWPVAGLVEFVRSTPLLVQIFFLFYVLPTIGIVLSPLRRRCACFGHSLQLLHLGSLPGRHQCDRLGTMGSRQSTQFFSVADLSLRDLAAGHPADHSRVGKLLDCHVQRRPAAVGDHRIGDSAACERSLATKHFATSSRSRSWALSS